MAFVFPGQGSQMVGMGRGLAEVSARARETFEEADRTLGFALSELCFKGPEAILSDTTNAQPAVFTALDAEAVAGVIARAGCSGAVVAANDSGPGRATTAASGGGETAVPRALRLGGARGVVPRRIGAPSPFPPMGRIADDLREF